MTPKEREAKARAKQWERYKPKPYTVVKVEETEEEIVITMKLMPEKRLETAASFFVILSSAA